MTASEFRPLNIAVDGSSAAVELEELHVARFRRYFEEYFHDEFHSGQGTEDILQILSRFGHHTGDWMDLGSGPSTLFWSTALTEVRSISCCDIFAEALKVLSDFVHDTCLPTCYRQVLDMYHRPTAHLDAMRRRVAHYYVFDAMKTWPPDLAGHDFDLVTEFGLFGLSPSPDAYLNCFDHLRPHVRTGGRIVGADWIRSPEHIAQQGHDNAYLSTDLVAQGVLRAGGELLDCRHVTIHGDPLYDALIVWAAGCGVGDRLAPTPR